MHCHSLLMGASSILLVGYWGHLATAAAPTPVDSVGGWVGGGGLLCRDTGTKLVQQLRETGWLSPSGKAGGPIWGGFHEGVGRELFKTQQLGGGSQTKLGTPSPLALLLFNSFGKSNPIKSI